MPGPSYLPEAVPTALGWAHPLTGEQLDCTKGLADPVDFYKPNAGHLSFLDPEGETTALIFTQALGPKKVKFAIHALSPVASVEWDFDDGEAPVVGTTSIVKVFDATATYDVTATVTYVDEELDPEVLTVSVVIAIPAAPANSVLPTITGGVVDVQMTSTNGTWSGVPTPTYTYQWFIEAGATDTAIEGATAATFTPGAELEGESVYLRVTATNAHGVVSANSAAQAITAA